MASRGKQAEAEYWRSRPLRAFAPLLCAVGATFGAIGFLTDIIDGASRPAWFVVVLAVYTGTYAVLLSIALLRKRRWIAPVVGVFILATVGLTRLAPPHPTSLEPGVHARLIFDASLTIGLLALGYATSIAFITKEGVTQVAYQTEMRLAARIQQALVPDVSSTTAAFEIYGRSHPGSAVGGDLVDVVEQATGIIAYVADVSGHGVSAAMLTSAVKTAARTAVEVDPRPCALLAAVNRVLPGVAAPAMYATCAAIRLDRAHTGAFSLAGHLPVLHYRCGSRSMVRLDQGALPLGLFPGAAYVDQEFRFERGDLFAILSDGLTEVVNAHDMQFGLEGVERVIGANLSASLAGIHERILAAVRAHGTQDDDQTLLLIRCSQ